tara:strand:- start:47 stop:2296 length:2250 start_codon:yes stop_codon:yes gene_type:complete
MTTLSTTQFNVQQPITTPQAGYKFYQPYFEDYQRRLGSGVFGTPGGVGGLINQPQDIPLQQTAGMTPLMMMARQGLMGASPYTPAYDTSSQLMGEAAGGYRASTGGFNPYTMISPYYDPFESQVVDDTLERMRRTSAQQDIAGRAQDISSGAFGGSRSRLLAKERQRESDRGIMQALAGIRSQGFQSARDAAMAENARRMAAMSGAAGGLGGIAGQVLGLGGQRQQEMMNYLQMMDQFGQGGRNIYETGLGRIQDAAMRRAQEPWERIMKGMGVLQGMKPGELVGGYGTTVPNVPPQSYQQPTGLGNVVDLATGIGDLFSLFGGGGKKDGGYIEKPKDYNAGGIVSGIVPVNMQDGGDAAQEMMDDLPDWVKKGMESDNFFERKAAMDYISTVGAIDLDPISDITEEGIEKAGMSGTGLEALLLSLLAAGKARKGNPKVVQQGKTAVQSWKSLLDKKLRERAAKANARKAAEKEARRKTAGIGGPKGKTPALTGPGTGTGGPRKATFGDIFGSGSAGAGAGVGTEAAKRTIGQRALDVIKKHPYISGGTGLGAAYIGGSYLFGDDDEEVPTADPEQFEEYLKLKQQEIEEAKTKAEKEELMADIIRTGNRLSEAMSAEGFKEVTLGDAGRIFGEERMDLPAKEAADLAALEQTAKASGMSLEEYLQLGQQDELALRGESKEALAQKVLEDGYAQYGVDFQNHPDVLSGKKSGAQLRLEMMNSLMSMGYEELKSFSKKLNEEIDVSANDS